MMKNLIAAAVLSLFAAQAVSAGALAQLPSGPAAAPAASLASSAPAAERGMLLLLDTRTGKTHVAVAAGGGFVYAATGKFQPAAFTGAGYVLPDGSYFAVVGGGSKAKAMKAAVPGSAAAELWRALDLAGRLEGMDFHAIEGGKDLLKADSVSCVDENYAGCTMFVNVAGSRRLLFTTDAAPALIRAFYAAGLAFDEETGILYASRAECSREGEKFSCDVAAE